uniref:hypothetical protein n=1 Tax=Candidatus Thiosymbion oneisti TaxID=589554 RepID=UPI001C402432
RRERGWGEGIKKMNRSTFSLINLPLPTTQFSFVTGLASVLGLLAFASSRKIKSTDFEKEELEKLKGLMNAAEELEAIERSKVRTEQELSDLDKKKKLMEVSIRKAGLALFYQEQYRKYADIVLGKVEEDGELKDALKEVREARGRLVAVKEEIAEDENVQIINEILRERRSGQTGAEPDVLVGPIDTLVSLSKTLGKLYNILLR